MTILLLIALFSILACVALSSLLQFAPEDVHNFILGLLMFCNALVFFGLSGAFFLHINCSYRVAMILAVCEAIVACFLVPLIDEYLRNPSSNNKG